ncbi:hypothetical protein AXG93_3818s1570 [Marchantia polymorpha subsp. ruderalis]|uniref:Uncharacterized protein n=1 Tax=Marchantia polymorpha subsp. ruderalis TaxID=1480154 RepID=A0A176VGS4_MARPO|nr:hypothetical protein AXG93_3818s1570 [Marchantia polymorpha subsp. ruderalis]
MSSSKAALHAGLICTAIRAENLSPARQLATITSRAHHSSAAAAGIQTCPSETIRVRKKNRRCLVRHLGLDPQESETQNHSPGLQRDPPWEFKADHARTTYVVRVPLQSLRQARCDSVDGSTRMEGDLDAYKNKGCCNDVLLGGSFASISQIDGPEYEIIRTLALAPLSDVRRRIDGRHARTDEAMMKVPTER